MAASLTFSDKQANKSLVATHAKYLRKLPTELAEYSAGKPLVLEPERKWLWDKWFWIEAGGVGLHATKQPSGYRFRQFSGPQDVLKSLKRLGPRHDDFPAILLPHVSEPMYRVEFGPARKRLGDLLEPAKGHLGLVRRDGAAGIVIRRFAGRLPGAPTSATMHYDVAVWGFARC